MTSIVAIEGLTKGYVRGRQRVEVLRSLDLEVATGVRQVEADQRARRRDAVECLGAGKDLGNRRQVGPFVLAAH